MYLMGTHQPHAASKTAAQNISPIHLRAPWAPSPGVIMNMHCSKGVSMAVGQDPPLAHQFNVSLAQNGSLNSKPGLELMATASARFFAISLSLARSSAAIFFF
mmetsp:Transcript_40535/g.81325  ORF Transcript_40535/g.81325 Transcript_40535/m.81325 type:complete len:103 (+) Transcript_40535:232-540(+)